MLVNVLIYLGGPIATTLLAGNGVKSLVEFSGGLGSVLQALLGTILVGVAWGVAYALVDLRWAAEWRDWARGVSFTGLALAFVVGLQLVAFAQRGEPLAAWLVQAIGEVIRWSAYGAFLGLTYPVLRARRVHAAEAKASDQTAVLVESPAE
jgi:hypothetical protein